MPIIQTVRIKVLALFGVLFSLFLIATTLSATPIANAASEHYFYEGNAAGNIRITESGVQNTYYTYVSGSKYTFGGALATITVSAADPGTGTLSTGGTVVITNTAAFQAAFPNGTTKQISSIQSGVVLNFGKTDTTLAVPQLTVNLCNAGVDCTSATNDVLILSQNNPSPSADTLSSAVIGYNPTPFNNVTVGQKYQVCAVADYIQNAKHALCQTVTATKSQLTVTLSGKGDPSKLSKVGGNNQLGGNCASLNKCDLITKYINPFINFLAALVGVAVVISIIIGGIQYSSSGGDPSQVTAAKNRIRNSIIALVTFLFLWALLNFLIPGGLV